MGRGVIACSLLLLGVGVQGQLSLGTTPYTQDFDSLSASGALVWKDDSTIPGWYAAKGSAPATTYVASRGFHPGAGIYSYGSDTQTERALGALVSDQSPSVGLGVRFKNDTASVLTDVTVGFTGEQWRVANTEPQSLQMSYRISTAPITDVDLGNTHTWSLLPQLSFESPSTLSMIIDLPQTQDGNLARNSVTLSSVLPGVSLLPGEELFLRWTLSKQPGLSQGLAVDNLRITAVPEPSLSSLVGLGGVLLFTCLKRSFSKNT